MVQIDCHKGRFTTDECSSDRPGIVFRSGPLTAVAGLVRMGQSVPRGTDAGTAPRGAPDLGQCDARLRRLYDAWYSHDPGHHDWDAARGSERRARERNGVIKQLIGWGAVVVWVRIAGDLAADGHPGRLRHSHLRSRRAAVLEDEGRVAICPIPTWTFLLTLPTSEVFVGECPIHFSKIFG